MPDVFKAILSLLGLHDVEDLTIGRDSPIIGVESLVKIKKFPSLMAF